MGNGSIRPEDEAQRRRRRDEVYYADEEAYVDEYEDEEYEDEPPVRRQIRPRPRAIQHIQQSPQRQRPYPPTTQRRTSNPTRPFRPHPRRKRSVWPILLGCCAIGIFFTVVAAAIVVFFTVRTAQTGGVPIIGGSIGGGTQTFTSEATQPITLSSLTQMQVCNKIGNVSIVVDPNVDIASIKTTKIVHMSSKASADQEFGHINVSVQQPTTGTQNLTCTSSTSSGTPGTSATSTASATGGAILINTTIPNSDGLLHGTGDAVDMKITLTPKLFATASTPLQLNIQAALGNVTLDGVSGILNILGSSGNVTVTRATLISGSSIGTGQGDVTFNGIVAAPNDATTQASFIIRSEQGKLDVTLPASTNLVLSANTNVGTIHSDFPITATSSSGSTSYRGPLNATAPTQSSAVLTLTVSTGDITIHKGAV
ncbi:MAG: hypothetical protein PVS3B3_28240 [Ktedonobacteraceae bacterium]